MDTREVFDGKLRLKQPQYRQHEAREKNYGSREEYCENYQVVALPLKRRFLIDAWRVRH
jgi:hypothetical protein